MVTTTSTRQLSYYDCVYEQPSRSLITIKRDCENHFPIRVIFVQIQPLQTNYSEMLHEAHSLIMVPNIQCSYN